MKLNSDVVGEMDHLVHDSLQCKCSLDKFRREQELKEIMDWAIQMMSCKANRVNVLVNQVLQLMCYLGLAAVLESINKKSTFLLASLALLDFLQSTYRLLG
jgi:hypothetical protein